MFTRKSMPIGAIFMILVIALALLGVGYALWSETLTIQGSVQTGEVDVALAGINKEECVDVNGVLTCPEPPEKAEAANCTVTEVGSSEANDDGTSTLQVEVVGMYPSYHCRVGFSVQNLGNVPVHVWLPEAAGDIPEWVATNFENCYTDGFQLHQGESTGVCTMDIHFTNDTAPEENSGPYTFGWTILATQWNEEPAAPPDVIRVESATMEFSSTGWAGWSCPADHPYVVGGTTDCALPLTYEGMAMPGATTTTTPVYTYPVYPHYTFSAGETGYVVQNGGTGQSCKIYVDCSTAP